MTANASNPTDSVGIVQTQYYEFAHPPNELQLDSGAKLGPITIAYETYGQLNATRSNAVLILHALSGDAHVAGRHTPGDPKPGWWDTMVGPGKPFDTNRYFIICSNVIGGCSGSTGPGATHPQTGKPYGLDFPIITIADMVRAQISLIDHLGIDTLLACAGGSMGGMQALEWATHHPQRLRSAIIIASTHVSGPQAIAFDAVGRHAILADKAFHSGQYYGLDQAPDRGLSIARMIGHITYLSEESMRAKFGRALRHDDAFRFDFDSEFSVETYLDYQGERFVDRFDANSYLYITKAIDYFDIAADHGSLDQAMTNVQCKTLIVSFSSDWLYPPGQSQEITYALARQNKDVTYCNIQSGYGHDAFLLEAETLGHTISGFLNHAVTPCAQCAKDPACRTCNPGSACPKQSTETPKAQSPSSIYDGYRIDYERIIELVEQGSRVLDIGCGDGVLLCKLAHAKNVHGVGIELNQDNAISCTECGVSVIHADVDQGLSTLPSQSFDYVILSMTLQVIQQPETVIREMLRVGRKCIVSFPNFAFWKVRAKLLLLGQAPITRNLPYAWHTSPNRHVLSIRDFRHFCQTYGARILQEVPISSHGRSVRTASFWPNLFADEAIFVITSE